MKSGAAGDSVYKPKFRYFYFLRFLDDPDTPRASCSNIDSSDDDTIDTQVATEDEMSRASNTETIVFSETEAQEQSSSGRSGATGFLSGEQNSPTNDILQTVNTHFKKPEDRFDVVGKTIAMKLRDLPRQQMLLAGKIINETLFEAEMGNLTVCHKLISQPATSQSQQEFTQYQSSSQAPFRNEQPFTQSQGALVGYNRQAQLEYQHENSIHSPLNEKN
ncbi:hypothetical protein FQR65_LT16268 [Abscondita terminalis]|nr:hypothetical protein FQR65_LT16268 [Abscondita terminalis]